MAGRPKTADLLRTFVELFANKKLPKPLGEVPLDRHNDPLSHARTHGKGPLE